MTHRDLVPASSLPLAYFALAHAGLVAGLATLIWQPDLPGGFFYHPRMVALVHALTLLWVTGSILGAFYVVAPLALQMPMPAARSDWIAFASFAVGATGMVTHFWLGEYGAMASAAVLVLAPIGWVGGRAWGGLARAPIPWGIKLHVALAFVNVLAAGILGGLIGVDRWRGMFGLSPLAATYAHAHLAAIGWAAMMIVGLGYRLIPMMLPARMPAGSHLATSALLIQAGLAVVVPALLVESVWLPVGGALIAAGLLSFVRQIRRTFSRRLPRPPALPARDWSAWQALSAVGWLVIAVVLGVRLSFPGLHDSRVTMAWCYGVAGLVGFLAQMVLGIQGRLVPMYAWYRAQAAVPGSAHPANALPSAPYARAVCLSWAVGVPLLAWGLASQRESAIAIAAAALLCGVLINSLYLVRMLRHARGTRP